jgi:hypothetical protein
MATATIRMWDSVTNQGFLKDVNEEDLVIVPLKHLSSNFAQARLIFDWCEEHDIEANYVSGSDTGSGFQQSFFIEDKSLRSYFTLRWC